MAAFNQYVVSWSIFIVQRRGLDYNHPQHEHYTASEPVSKEILRLYVEYSSVQTDSTGMGHRIVQNRIEIGPRP